MQVLHEPDLKLLNSFKVPAQAQQLIRIDHGSEIPIALEQCQDLPVLILGGGSNMVFVNNFPGVVLHLANQGITYTDMGENQISVRIAAGKNWHRLVMACCQQNLWGLENLALIPGSAGAAPVQNIGAYGVELSRLLNRVEVYDRYHNIWQNLDRNQCEFAYRDSIFKKEPDRYVIRAIHITLSARPVLTYPDVIKQLSSEKTDQLNPLKIANEICAIRQSKLPNPDVLPNAGSFFKNPVIHADTHINLPDSAPRFKQGDQIKISAAWLIDQCGYKGTQMNDVGVYERHALVLVNLGQATGKDILTLSEKIQYSVAQRFGIHLEPEPLIIN